MDNSENKFNPEKYLPLTESTYYILLALIEPLHGYGVMQQVDQISDSTTTLGPGTLYGAFSTLQKQKLIEKVSEEGRRKCYSLTTKGRIVLKEQIKRLEIMARVGQEMIRKL